MARENTILVWACLFVVSLIAIALTEECPSKEDMPSCTCVEWNEGSGIKCNKIDDEQLANVASSLRGRKVRYLHIYDSNFSTIPHDVFKGVQLSVIGIMNSTLVDLTDTREAFVGLEAHLVSLSISSCSFVNEWDWSVLKDLQKLKELFIRSSFHRETIIGKYVMRVSVSPSVETIDLDGNYIAVVSDRAFDLFKNITFLTLSNNRIKNVKRTMLPNPTVLQQVDFSHNLIEQFPKDMFTKMSSLRHINIDYNKILVLDENTFSLVWEQLQGFHTLGNVLHCDCNMSWLLKKKTPYILYGECASPPELETMKLTKLEAKDLVCIK